MKTAILLATLILSLSSCKSYKKRQQDREIIKRSDNDFYPKYPSNPAPYEGMPVSEFLTQIGGEEYKRWGKLYQIRLSHSSETWKFIDKTLRDIKNIKEFPSLKNGVLQEGEKLEVYEIQWSRFTEGTTFIFRDDKLSTVFGDPTKKGNSWYYGRKLKKKNKV
tara:strand:+ start:71 stop:559 length:489 start_codon:yes stop_codon:yes gene_type:complete